MPSEDSAGVGVGLAELAGGKPSSIGCEGESSDPAEEINVCPSFIHLLKAPTRREGCMNTRMDAPMLLGGVPS